MPAVQDRHCTHCFHFQNGSLCMRCPLCRCIWSGPDDQGIMGTYLGKNVVAEASKSLTQAMVKVGVPANG